MHKSIISERLKKYSPKIKEQEENALKEILQEISLYALSTTDFFKEALFQGDTSLRILYQLPRFSEDLNLILLKPNENFKWQKYIDEIQKALILYGIEPEITDRSKANTAVQKLFLKDNSIGKLLNLHFNYQKDRKLLIKFEIDTNPLLGSTQELKYLDFPIDYSINTQDLLSNFSGKCHALLCRPYIKGHDWFDFLWYLSKNTAVNYTFLKNALQQLGPWQNQSNNIDAKWLKSALQAKIEMGRFLNLAQQKALDLWSTEFFLAKTLQLTNQL